MSGSPAKNRRLVFSVSEEEAIRLEQIIMDGDAEEALRFLREHGKKPLHDFFESG